MLHAQGHPQARAKVPHERLVAVGRRAAQVMVHMEDVQPLAGDARAAAAVVYIERARACHEQQRG